MRALPNVLLLSALSTLSACGEPVVISDNIVTEFVGAQRVDELAPLLVEGAVFVLTATTAYYRQAVRPGAGKSWRLMLGQVPCPALLLMGEDDGCIGWDFARRSAKPEYFPAGLTVTGLANAGHFAHQERPDDVNTAALAWLQRLGQSAHSHSGEP